MSSKPLLKDQLISGKYKGEPCVFSSKELSKILGNRMALNRLVEASRLISLGAGYYSTPNIEPFAGQVLVVSRFYPKVIISGISALIIHKLSDERLEKITVDISRTTRLVNRLVMTRRVAKSRMIGITSMNYFGQKIRIYDKERTLCDAYRIDRGALFLNALKRYKQQYSPNAEKIAEYDKKLGTKVLLALQQELASE